MFRAAAAEAINLAWQCVVYVQRHMCWHRAPPHACMPMPKVCLCGICDLARSSRELTVCAQVHGAWQVRL